MSLEIKQFKIMSGVSPLTIAKFFKSWLVFCYQAMLAEFRVFLDDWHTWKGQSEALRHEWKNPYLQVGNFDRSIYQIITFFFAILFRMAVWRPCLQSVVHLRVTLVSYANIKIPIITFIILVKYSSWTS